MKTFHTSILLTSAIFLTVACEQRSTSTTTDSVSSPSTPSPSQPPDPRAEALSAAEKEWAKAWIQDGETWIARSADRPYLLQIKGKRTEVSADQLSEADRLNGIQWLGGVEVFFAAKRQFGLQSYSGLSGRFQAGWNKWETDERPLAIFNLKKEAGRWTLLEHSISQSHALGFIQDKMVRPTEADLRAAQGPSGTQQ